MINNNDGSFSISGSGTLTNDFSASYTLKHEELVRIIKPGSINLKNGLKQSMYFEVSFLSETLGNHYIRDGAFEITQEMLDTSDFRIMFIVYGKSGASIPDATFKPMFYQDGDGTWEPFTGGKPSPAYDNESPIVDVGDKGYIALDIAGGGVKPQKLTLATPNGLPGLKALSKENYTDENGQRWICDEIDLAREKHIQKCYLFDVDINKCNLQSINSNGIANFSFLLPRLCMNNVAKEYCNCFVKSDLLISNETKESFFINGTTLSIRVKATEASTKEEFISLFKDKPIQVLYALQSPIERDLSAEEINAFKRLTLNSGTNMIHNDENAEMEFTYTVDTKTYVDTKIAEVSTAIVQKGIENV